MATAALGGAEVGTAELIGCGHCHCPVLVLVLVLVFCVEFRVVQPQMKRSLLVSKRDK